MGRELQKKKNRSSIPRVRQKPKSKKKILANPIIAANWRQDETLTQNYRRLGLVSKLNKRTGGIDKTPSASTSSAPGASDAFLVKSTASSKASKQAIDPTAVRVQRDPKTGAIVSILDASKANPLNDPLNDLEEDEDEERDWNPHEFAHVPAIGETGSELVKELAKQAANGRRSAPRKQSERELEWVGRLVSKYGENYDAMARDMKLNPMQQTAGDLKRRAKKWKAANEMET